jgi:DNA-binding NtrC family response regulator
MPFARLLIVEDEVLITFAMRRYFLAQGFEVDCASELDDAETLVASRPYDVVIADLRLSGAGGTEGLDLLAFVREKSPAARTILLTSYGSPEVAAAAHSRGAAAVILKPKPLPDLAQVVMSLLDLQSKP